MWIWIKNTFWPWWTIKKLNLHVSYLQARLSQAYSDVREMREELINYRDGFGRDYEICRSAAQAQYWHQKWEILWKRTHRIPTGIEIVTCPDFSRSEGIRRSSTIDCEAVGPEVATTLPTQEEDE